MTKDQAIRIAREFIESMKTLEINQGSAAAHLVPAHQRPEEDAKTDAWAISFPYIVPKGMVTKPSSFVLLVDVSTGVISLPWTV
jgi:hypothetical protein